MKKILRDKLNMGKEEKELIKELSKFFVGNIIICTTQKVCYLCTQVDNK